MSAKQTPTWDSFLASILDKGYVSRAAICRIKDGKRWTATPRFEVSSAEAAEIAAGFEDGGTMLRKNGLYVAHHKYTLTYVNNTIMAGRDSATGTGCVIYRCNTCFVIGAYDDCHCWGGCYSVVCRMGDFLRYDGF